MATLTSLGFNIFSTYDGSGMRRARRDVNDLANNLNNASSGLNTFTGRMGALVSVAAAFGPALLPIGETALGVASGLTAMGITAGSALGAYGIAVAGAITRTLEMAEAGRKLVPAQANLANAVENLVNHWDKLILSVARSPAIMGAAVNVIRGLTAGIMQLPPVIKAVQPIVGSVAVAFRAWMEDSNTGFGRFVDAVIKFGIPALNNLVHAGRDILATLGFAFRAMLPLVIPLSEAIRKGAAYLREWAEGGGFDRFVARVLQQAPAVKEFFAALIAALRNVFDAMRILAPISLELTTQLLKLVAAVPPDVLAGIAAGFAAMNLGIMPLINALSTAVGWLIQLAPAIARATPLMWALTLVGAALAQNWDIIVGVAKQLWAAIQDNLLPAFQSFWDNIQEGWQNIQPFIQLLGTILRPVLIALGFVLVNVVVPALALMVKGAGELIAIITQLIGWFGQAVNFVIGNFVPAMQQVAAFFSGPFLVPFKAVGAFFAGPFVRFFTDTIPRIAAAIGGWVTGAVAAIGRFFASIGTAISNWFSGPFVRFFTEAIPKMVAAIGRWWAGIATSVGGFFISLAKDFATKIADLVTKVLQWGKDLAKNLLDGLVQGIKNGAGAAWEAIKDIAKGVGGFFAKILGIGSPSTVFAQYGMDLNAGLTQGITAGAVQALTAAAQLGTNVINGLKQAFVGMQQVGMVAMQMLMLGFQHGLASLLIMVQTFGPLVTSALSVAFTGARTVAMAAMASMTATVRAGMLAIRTAIIGAQVALAFTTAFATARAVVVAAINAIVISVRAGMANVRAAIVAAQVSAAFTAAFSGARAAVVASINSIVITVRSGMANVRAAVVGAQVQTAFNTSFAAARAAVAAHMNAIAVVVRTIMTSIVAIVRTGMAQLLSAITSSPLRSTWQALWSGMVAIATASWNQMRAAWQATVAAMVAQANTLRTSVVAALTAMATQGIAQVNNMRTAITAAWNSILSSTTSIWNSIRTTVLNAINAMVGPINGLIEGFNNVASALDVGTTIPTISAGAANGGVFFANGGFANMRHGGAVSGYAPGKDTFPAMLSRGEGVLVPEAVRGLGGPGFVYAANSHFSHGRTGHWTKGHESRQRGQSLHGMGFADGGMAGGSGGLLNDAGLLSFLIGIIPGNVAAALARAGVSTSLVTQGSYSTGVAASAGTHAGGGVIDLGTTSTAVLAALISAGFAAWIRTPAQGFAPHIHAVLMGDPTLSPQAAAQVISFLAGGTGLGVGSAAGVPMLDVAQIFKDIVGGDASAVPPGMEQFILMMLTEDIVTDGFADLKADLDGANPGAGMWGESLIKMGELIYQGIIDKIMAAAEEAKAAMAAMAAAGGGAGVQQWAALAAQALALAGLDPGQLGAFLALMQAESGGNPNAINLTDSNAAAGIPSQGLMQLIPPTFAAYNITGGGILDPLSNMAAAAAYIKAVYGGIVPGSPYARGSLSASSGWHRMNERGGEMVKMRGGETVVSAKATQRAWQKSGTGGNHVEFKEGCFNFQFNGGVTKDAIPAIKNDLVPALRQAVEAGVGKRWLGGRGVPR